MSNTPLGKYAPVAALVGCLGMLLAYALAVLHDDTAAASALFPFALAGFGAIIGSSVAVNGWKGPLQAVHARLDAAGIPAAGGEGK